MRVLLFTCLFVGCPAATLPTDIPSPTDSTPVCEQPLRCWIGHGEDGFEPWTGTAPIVFGPQGGWHVEVVVEATSTTPILRVLPTITDETGRVWSGADGQLDTFNQFLEYDEPTCTGHSLPMFVLVDDLPTIDQDVICSLEGSSIDIHLAVSDQTGEDAECTATAVATLDDPGACP